MAKCEDVFCIPCWMPDMHAAELSPNPAGTSEWEPFRSWEYSEKSVARAALAEHHKLQLQRMGTEMGEDGNKVLDLGNMKDLLELTDGEP